MKHVLFLLLLVSTSLLVAKQPNIIVLITDDQGWADIGYNNDKVYTPHLDTLAKDSALLTQHYVMPQCTPTRIAAFTGRYPGRFGNEGLTASTEPVFPHGTLNLASYLKSAGYNTYLSGKWHLGVDPAYGPSHFGFDSTYGSRAGAVGFYDHRYRPGHKYEITWHRDNKIIEGYENGEHVTDLMTKEAVRVIQENKDTETPFFLYLAYHAPHTPLDERGEFIDTPTQLDPNRPGRWLNEDNIPWFHDDKGIIQAEQDPEKRLLLAVLHHLDDGIGKVVKALDDTAQRDDTIIFFSSDNGPQGSWKGNAYPDDLKLTDFNQEIPFRGVKCDAYQGGILVPGFIHWRGKVPAKQLADPVHIIDWFPTIASFVKHPLVVPEDQPQLDGLDLSKLILGEQTTISDRPLYQIWGKPAKKWSLTYQNWKIVKYGKQDPTLNQWELYNLTLDPAESKNIAQTHSEKVQELHSLFLIERAKDKQTKSNTQ